MGVMKLSHFLKNVSGQQSDPPPPTSNLLLDNLFHTDLELIFAFPERGYYM